MAITAAASCAEGSAFETSYARLIRANCLRCHNPRNAMGGLDLSSREGLLRGGDTEPAILVGEPDASLLIQRVTEGSMPPINDGDQLAAEDVELLRSWISAGAVWSGPGLARAEPSSRVEPIRKRAHPRRIGWWRAWRLGKRM